MLSIGTKMTTSTGSLVKILSKVNDTTYLVEEVMDSTSYLQSLLRDNTPGITKDSVRTAYQEQYHGSKTHNAEGVELVSAWLSREVLSSTQKKDKNRNG
jgi:hypothetical protein